MNKEKQTKSAILLECERWWIFALMICTGGFYGGYTFSCRGGVFCNAQTANFVLFGMAIGTADWSKAVYYLIPMASYFLGTIISEFIPTKIKNNSFIRWETAVVIFEIIVVLVLGFIPESAPVQICQITVNFMCSIQYNTFRNAENIPTSTTFCTAHVRSMGVYFTKWLQNKTDTDYLKRSLFHAGMICSFILGAIIASFTTKFFGTKSIWFAEFFLIVVFADLLHADRTKEKNMHSRTTDMQ